MHSLYFVFLTAIRLPSSYKMTIRDELDLFHGVKPYIGRMGGAGQPTESLPGIFQFTGLSQTNSQQFYQVRAP
jgi:hypothetical protein